MAPRTFYLATALWLISGCAQMPGSPPPSPPPDVKILTCGGASCDVKVAVNCKAYVFCWIEADSEWIKVPANNSPVITWQVVTPGYEFTRNGIAFIGDNPFDCHPAGNTKFMCNDRHAKPGIYKYTITLIGFPLVFPKDPWIENL